MTAARCLSKVGTAASAQTFSKSYLHEVSARLYQGIVPDGATDTQDCDASPFPSPNPLVGRKAFVEHKTLASLLISVQARA